MINSKGGAKLLSNSIKQRLKILEILSNKNTPNIPNPLVYFDTEPNGDIYKISSSFIDSDYFINIKDADKLRFKDYQECQEWIDSNIDLFNLPTHYDYKRHKLKPFLIKIVDNSHLESVMYSENRQDSKGG